MKKIGKYSIYIQVALALLLIGVLHKFVREIPANIKYAEILSSQSPIVLVVITLIIWVVGLILTLLKLRIGLVIGFISGFERFLLPILFHGISGIPADPVYYPIFCLTQGILTMWFCYQAYKNFDFVNITQD